MMESPLTRVWISNTVMIKINSSQTVHNISNILQRLVAHFQFFSITVIAEILRKSSRTTFWRTPRRTSYELFEACRRLRFHFQRKIANVYRTTVPANQTALKLTRQRLVGNIVLTAFVTFLALLKNSEPYIAASLNCQLNIFSTLQPNSN